MERFYQARQMNITRLSGSESYSAAKLTNLQFHLRIEAEQRKAAIQMKSRQVQTSSRLHTWTKVSRIALRAAAVGCVCSW
jgi:hypothetical protein